MAHRKFVDFPTKKLVIFQFAKCKRLPSRVARVRPKGASSFDPEIPGWKSWGYLFKLFKKREIGISYPWYNQQPLWLLVISNNIPVDISNLWKWYPQYIYIYTYPQFIPITSLLNPLKNRDISRKNPFNRRSPVPSLQVLRWGQLPAGCKVMSAAVPHLSSHVCGEFSMKLWI